MVANITIAVDAVPERYDVMVTTSRGKKGIGTERFAVVTVTDLSTLGGASSVARAVDSEGRIVGRSALASGQFRAFVWTDATGMTELPSTDGNAVAIANGIIVGRSGTRAARWTFEAGGWVLTQLGGLGSTNDMAWDINETGLIVGTAGSSAVQWTANTGPTPLPVLAGGTGSQQALGVNGSGSVVGVHDVATGHLPIVWPRGGAAIRLPGCPGATGARAEAINDAGLIVGYCSFPKANFQAVRWLPGPDPDSWLAPQALTSSTGANRAWDINNAGQIVGSAAGKAFLWEEGVGLRILEGLVLNGDSDGFGISEVIAGIEVRIVGWSGKAGASAGNHAVWWPAP